MPIGSICGVIASIAALLFALESGFPLRESEKAGTEVRAPVLMLSVRDSRSFGVNRVRSPVRPVT